METTLGQRLKRWLAEQEISAYRLAKDIEVSTQAVYGLTNDQTTPSVETLRRLIITYPALDIRWLIIGEDDTPAPKRTKPKRGRPRKIAALVVANAPTAANTPTQPLDAEISANSGVNTLEKKYKIKCGPIVRNLWNMRKAGPLNLPL